MWPLKMEGTKREAWPRWVGPRASVKKPHTVAKFTEVAGTQLYSVHTAHTSRTHNSPTHSPGPYHPPTLFLSALRIVSGSSVSNRPSLITSSTTNARRVYLSSSTPALGVRPRTSDRAVMIARSASDAAASKQGSGSGGVCESVEPEGRERRSNP